ncbi:MAG: GNAT family N-acetyltransferase [Acetobacteraceae bacterium]|nr:GNAT family N-acetyltransferase [Acetobacteraceae bacterium]
MDLVIRPLNADDAEMYRSIRLEALRAHPEAFGASFDAEAARPVAFFAERLTASAVFAGVHNGTLLGTAGFRAESGPKQAHKGLLWGMYVRPIARGSGLARRLVEAVLDHARERVELIQLRVVADNAVARALYASLGFEPYGIEARSLKIEGRYLDEVLMVKMPP